jgi:hypothetical protein
MDGVLIIIIDQLFIALCFTLAYICCYSRNSTRYCAIGASKLLRRLLSSFSTMLLNMRSSFSKSSITGRC